MPRHDDLRDRVAHTYGTRRARNNARSPHHDQDHGTRSGRDNVCSPRRDQAHAGRDDTGSGGHRAGSQPDHCRPWLDACARGDGTVPGHHGHWSVPCVLDPLSVTAYRGPVSPFTADSTSL